MSEIVDKVFTLVPKAKPGEKQKKEKFDHESDIEPFISKLRESTDIEQINLADSSLGIGASKALAQVLETKQTLQIANLDDIFTGRLLSEIPTAIEFLLEALLKLTKLHTVNLNDNAFGLNTVDPLVSFLSRHTPLRHLYLNNNGLGPAAGSLVAGALQELSVRKEAARKEGKDIPDLETVVCGRNRLEPGSMSAWAKAYEAHKGVKVVKMTQNGIRIGGLAHVLEQGLSHCRSLEVLNLQDNAFTKAGFVALCSVVENSHELRELGLNDTYLLSDGGELLGETLQKGKNIKLEILRVSGNELGSKGVAAIAGALKSLPALRRVEIVHDNQLTKDNGSLAKLRKALKGRQEDFKDTQTSEQLAAHEDAVSNAAEHEQREWGLDEQRDDEDDDEVFIDDEDEEDIDEREDEEDGVQEAAEAAREIIETHRAENGKAPQDKDKQVDELADLLGKAEIK